MDGERAGIRVAEVGTEKCNIKGGCRKERRDIPANIER